MKFSQEDLDLAHQHSSYHFKDVTSSIICGCFCCLGMFYHHEIKEWIDKGQTALCPKCSIDSVLGKESGWNQDPEFLVAMKEAWFKGLKA